MKGTKKVLSIALAIVMALSCMMPAFAEGGALKITQRMGTAVDGLVAALRNAAKSDELLAAEAALQALMNSSTNIATARPSDETQAANYDAQLERYNAAIAAWKAITSEEKDAVDYGLAVHLFHEVVKRESYLERGNTIPASKTIITAKITDYLGTSPSLSAALALVEPLTTLDGDAPILNTETDFTVSAKQTALQNYFNAYKAATPATRAYADALYVFVSSYVQFCCFNGEYSASAGTRAGDLAVMLGAYYYALDPSSTTVPTSPNYRDFVTGDYTDGRRNPEYVTAKNAYETALVTVNNYKALKNMQAIKDVAAAAPELNLGDGVDVLEQMMLGCHEFLEDRDYSTAAAAMEAYDALDDNEKRAASLFNIYGLYLYSYTTPHATYGYLQSYNRTSSQLYNQCSTYVSSAAIADFEEYIDSIKIDAITNAVVLASEAEFNAIPTALRGLISEETLEKYLSIQNMYKPQQPMVPSRDMYEEELNAFVPTNLWELKVPLMRPGLNMNIAATDNLLASMLRLALQYNATGSIKGASNYSFFSNSSMSLLIKLFGVIGPVLADIPMVGGNVANSLLPEQFVHFLPEDKFAGARAKLTAAAEADNSLAAYDSIAFENGDWGFEDGDKEGFLNALVALFRPFGSLAAIAFPNFANYKSARGDYYYGTYETIVPIFESLNLRGVLSSEDFTDMYAEYMAADSTNGARDAIFTVLFTPIVNLVEDVMANPLETILDLLPRLARAINSGSLDAQVKAIFETLGSIVAGALDLNLDLTADGVNAMIEGQTISIDIGSSATATISLEAIDWAALAGCGTLEVIPSVSAANAYRVDIIPNRPAAYILLGKYLLRALFSTTIAGKTETLDILADAQQ